MTENLTSFFKVYNKIFENRKKKTLEVVMNITYQQREYKWEVIKNVVRVCPPLWPGAREWEYSHSPTVL